MNNNLTTSIEREANIICGLLVREILNAETFSDIKDAADAIFKVRVQAKQMASERDMMANAAAQCQSGIASGFAAYGRQ